MHTQLYEAKPWTVTEGQQAPPKVRAEEVRLLIAEAIKQAIDIFDADEEDLKSAQDKLENALLKLEDADADEELKAELRTELKELLKLLHTPAINKMHARPFAYSLLISLATQRHTARGNNIGKFQLFATPTMQKFLAETKFQETMSRKLDDDDPIVLPADSGTTRPTVPGRIRPRIRRNNKAPLEENIQKVMLELYGNRQSRSGLDLVVVLDVTHSMGGGKLEELQTAMQFVIKKLNVVDRLSIVQYKSHAERLCPLRQMTQSTQTELQNLINHLVYSMDNMNITDGLLMALKILNDRSVSSGRAGAIMLISGCNENRGNAAAVPVGNVPVHTFGFGNDHDPKVLKAIANNSLGGTYSDVRVDNLTLAFSQCLGGLLSVVAQDLTVTINQIKDNSTIRQVYAGSYLKSMDNTAGPVTITFGDIYIQEIRKVLVDLHLPSTRIKHDADVLEVSYTYKFNGELFEAKPETVTVCRMSRLTAEEQQTLPKVRTEEVRLLIAEAIKQAIDIFDADEEDLKSAKDKLENGLLKLENADIEELKAGLRTELKELLKLLHTRAIYKGRRYNVKVRPFAYSLLISLATQRQTARGNNIGKFQLFSTPAMQELLEEAKELLEISESFNDDEPVDPGSSGSGSVPVVSPFIP
ncbi:uncharacterized protein LOC144548389 [Carex rostrata]